MIELKHQTIEDLPVIEVYPKGKEKELLPTVFFYHGWESRKERVIEYGYVLAQKGFRAILPEALDHGERRAEVEAANDPMNFWKIVVQSVQEFPVLVNYYLEQKKMDKDKIGVAGLSMGGITTSAMLTQYEWIHAAAVLMGSPNPIEFTEWLLKNYKIDGTALYDLLDQEMIATRLQELEGISLNKQPEKIAGRPLYFWHGTEDPIVPIHITKHFIETIKNEPYSRQLEFETSAGVKHRVPQTIILKMSQFFDKTLNKNNKASL